MSNVHPALLVRHAWSVIATEKGSSPVEHPALHTRTCLGRAPRAASDSHAGRSSSVRYAKWFRSRKKRVSLVVIRSSIRVSSWSSAASTMAR